MGCAQALRLAPATLAFKAAKKRTCGCRYVWKGLERLPQTIAQIRSEDFSGGRAAGIGRAGERREKSLGLLSQRFVQIFVQSPDNHSVPLDTAAEMLLGEPGLHDDSQQAEVILLWAIWMLFLDAFAKCGRQTRSAYTVSAPHHVRGVRRP